jgi:hypothetical protein
MAREVMTWNNPTVAIAATQAELDTAPTVECQVTSAVLTPQPVYNTIPATGCAGASQSPGRTGFQLDLAWLQDWTKPADESLSRYAYDNDGSSAWVRVVHDSTVTTGTEVDMEGQFFVASGGFGGTFGDGSAGATTAAWPAVDKPTITSPAALPLADTDESVPTPAAARVA